MNCPRCNTDIDSHPEGPCLDAWVAETVMGWTDIEDRGIVNYDGGVRVITGRIRPDLPSHAIDEFSTTGDGMLEVMEKIWLDRLEKGGEGWLCSITTSRCVDYSTSVKASAPTAPLAVCRAALKACAGGEK